MTLPRRVPQYTPQEYYRLERGAEYRSEYYDGEIFAMAGGSARHSLICANVTGELRLRLKGGPCTVFESNLRLKIKSTGLRTYPDLSVYCDALQADDQDASGETYTNPAVLVEVLSKSTEAYDRGFKSENYRQIESLRAYLLVSQERPHVEVHERQRDGLWTIHETSGMEGMVQIHALGVEVPMAEIYAGVTFGDSDQSRPGSSSKSDSTD